jgi:putative hydrolase of the HAD superfamily
MNQRKYLSHKKHLFFDLDRTLWDFDSNSASTFHDIYAKFEINQLSGVNFDTLFHDYQEINHGLWDLYRKGKIEKDFLNVERFHLALKKHGINNRELAAKIAADYIRISPTKKALYKGTHETLSYLKQRGYKLHIITNGFPEVQHVKLKNANLEQYFEQVIISEEVGYKKPSPKIFRIALAMSTATIEESVMIGDDPQVDVLGAMNIGITGIFVNHIKEPKCDFCDFSVNDLESLQMLF